MIGYYDKAKQSQKRFGMSSQCVDLALEIDIIAARKPRYPEGKPGLSPALLIKYILQMSLREFSVWWPFSPFFRRKTSCFAFGKLATLPIHSYAPKSFSVTLWKTSSLDVPRILESPFLLHITVGAGLPVISHLNVAMSPTSTSWFDAVVVNFGPSIQQQKPRHNESIVSFRTRYS